MRCKKREYDAPQNEEATRFKVRRYADRMIDIDKYLYVVPGAKASERTCETDLNGFFCTACLTYVAGRHTARGLILKQLLTSFVNIFEPMRIAEYI